MEFRLGPIVRAFLAVARIGTRIWMRFVMNPSIVYRLPDRLEPPYLVISNHVMVYDGLVVTMHLKHLPVVVFDDVQRLNAFNRFMFTKMGVVFKAFGVSDPLSIRSMMRARDAKRSIFLYPEGEITWTGDSKPIEPSFARLVKLLGIPVAMVKVKGAYSICPKWARRFRKGSSIFEYDLILTPEDISRMGEDELLEHLRSRHSHKELDWLRSPEGRQNDLRASCPAAGLECLLFCCPDCLGTNCMKTDDHRLFCDRCGMSVEVGGDMGLRTVRGRTGFSDIRDWHTWQKGHLNSLLDGIPRESQPLLTAVSGWVKRAGVSGGRTEVVGGGTVELFADRINYESRDGGSTDIALSDIRACHCYRFAPTQDNKLLIRTSQNFFIFDLEEPNSPVLSWEIAINSLRSGERDGK